MASKKKTSGKVTAHKFSRFLHKEAEDAFEIYKTKPVIYERGFFLSTSGWGSEYAAQIDKQSWASFCHPREEAIFPIVYEFYANAKFGTGRVAVVRGKEVHFSPAAINAYFDINPCLPDDYTTLQSTLTPEDIAKVICHTQEDLWVNLNTYVLKASSLHREAKVWLMFINSNIFPTKNSTNVSVDRALLLYCIITGCSTNVGKLISEQLCTLLHAKKYQTLWFPTLITSLCRYAGVSIADTDIHTPVGHHITKAVIEAYVKVPVEHDDVPLFRMKRPSSSKPSSHTLPEKHAPDQPSSSHSSDMLDYMRYIASSVRLTHLKSTAHLSLIHQNQLKIMRKLKVPPGDQSLPFKVHFDDAGFLVDKDGNRLKPFTDGNEEIPTDDDDEVGAADDDDDGDGGDDEE